MEIPAEVGKSPTLGIRGLLATRDLTEGEVIERCPVVLLPAAQGETLDQTVLTSYYFLWDAEHCAMALGYGSFQNHSYHANVRFRRDFAALQIVFTTARRVRQGEELTINYNGDPDDQTPLAAEFGIPAPSHP